MQDGLGVKTVAGFFCAAALAGCSLWLNTDERQCRTDSDCESAGLGSVCVDLVCTESSECVGDDCDSDATTSDSELAVMGSCEDDKDCGEDKPRCLYKNCVDAQTGDHWLCPAGDQSVKTSTVRYSFHVVDFLTREPPPGITAKACRVNDVGCDEPVDSFTDTDMTGHVQLTLPTGFLGFFEIESDDSMLTLLYVTKPIEKNTLNRDLPVLTAQTVELTASITGYSFDKEKGLALIEALDCSGTPQGGVHFKSREGGDPFYLVDQVPSKEATLTVYDEANNTANGGFINVPTGFVTFDATLGLDGLTLGSFNAQIRPNAITFINMHF